MNLEEELKRTREDIKTLQEIALSHQEAIKNLCTVITHLANGMGANRDGGEIQGSDVDYYVDWASRMTSN